MVDTICVECKNTFDAKPVRGFRSRADFICKACKSEDELTIGEIQAKHKEAMLKFVIKRTG